MNTRRWIDHITKLSDSVNAWSNWVITSASAPYILAHLPLYPLTLAFKTRKQKYLASAAFISEIQNTPA
jgi:hypothetical protein